MEENQKFTFSVYTENNIGILNRLSAIFLKRHISIESLTVSKSEIEKARKIVLAFDYAKTKGLGVVSLCSKMIDPPV